MNAGSGQYIQLPLWPPSGQVSAPPDSAFIPDAGPSSHKDIIAERNRKHHSKYKSEHLRQVKEWKSKNREKYLEQKRRHFNKNRLNPKFVLTNRIRRGIFKSFHGIKHGPHWEILVGYTKEDLRNHIESLFTQGMTWELLLKGKMHIDHKTPQSFFIYDKPEDQEFQYCWSLDNLQPLWAKDNLVKGKKLINKGEK